MPKPCLRKDAFELGKKCLAHFAFTREALDRVRLQLRFENEDAVALPADAGVHNRLASGEKLDAKYGLMTGGGHRVKVLPAPQRSELLCFRAFNSFSFFDSPEPVFSGLQFLHFDLIDGR